MKIKPEIRYRLISDEMTNEFGTEFDHSSKDKFKTKLRTIVTVNLNKNALSNKSNDQFKSRWKKLHTGICKKNEHKSSDESKTNANLNGYRTSGVYKSHFNTETISEIDLK